MGASKTASPSSPGGMVEVSIILKCPNDSGVVGPVISPCESPIWPLQKLDESWKTTAGYYKLK